MTESGKGKSGSRRLASSGARPVCLLGGSRQSRVPALWMMSSGLRPSAHTQQTLQTLQRLGRRLHTEGRQQLGPSEGWAGGAPVSPGWAEQGGPQLTRPGLLPALHQCPGSTEHPQTGLGVSSAGASRRALPGLAWGAGVCRPQAWLQSRPGYHSAHEGLLHRSPGLPDVGDSAGLPGCASTSF